MAQEPDPQTSEADTAGAVDLVPGRPIEEIEVTGQRPLRFLLRDIERAEEHMYGLFNQLNDNSDFRVVCRSVIVTGSKIPDRECVPAYIDRERSRNAQDFLQLGILQKPDEQIWFENRHKQEAFNTKIRELALEHPELARSMLDLHAKRQELEALQARQRQESKGWLGRLFSRGREDD